MKKLQIRTALFTALAAAAFVAGGFQSPAWTEEITKDKSDESRWLNWQAIDPTATTPPNSPYDMVNGLTFQTTSGESIQADNCVDLAGIGDNQVAEHEYTAWALAKANCEAVLRYFSAPPASKTNWPNVPFDYAFLVTLPATVIPNTGPAVHNVDGKLQGLSPRQVRGATAEHTVEVKLADMLVNYVLLAKADFNQDGYQDLFIRMDWAIEGTFGSGHDWVVVTRTPDTPSPMLLWRAR